MQNVRVSSLDSPRSGAPVANQFTIRTDEGEYFQSYNTIIGFYDWQTREITLDTNSWNYSRTTSKYRHQWMRSYGLNLTTKELERGIKDGTIKSANLNP